MGQRAADGFYSQAVAKFKQGKPAEVMRLCRKALAADSRHGPAHHLLATVLYGTGQADDSLNHARQAVAADPEAVNFLSTLAQIQINLRQAHDAVATLQTAVQRHPREVDLHLHLAAALAATGEFEPAWQACRQAVALAPNSLKVLLRCGDILFELDRPDEALKAYRRAAELEPANPAAHFGCGKVHQGLRQYDQARASLTRAADLNPAFAQPWVLLARQDPGRPDDRRIAALEGLLGGDTLPLEDRIQASFALGKLYEDSGQYAPAFARYLTANQLRSRQQPSDALVERFAWEIEFYRTHLGGDFFAARADWGELTDLPVFVVGMPRSGTTLVETILAAHPAVRGSGELPHVPEIARRLLGSLPLDRWPARLAELRAGQVNLAAQTLRDHLEALAGGARRLVDKLPGNFLHLWLISLLFPRAAVIHCRRDPRDTCVSCFCTDFAQAHAYSCDLAILGGFYRLYESLMEHWERAVPLRMLEIGYEDLVADQERISRRMIEFIGLDWDPGCLEFQRARPRQTVRTASNVQVGRKIYGSSVGRWRRFEPYLDPLLGALGPTTSKK